MKYLATILFVLLFSYIDCFTQSDMVVIPEPDGFTLTNITEVRFSTSGNFIAIVNESNGTILLKKSGKLCSFFTFRSDYIDSAAIHFPPYRFYQATHLYQFAPSKSARERLVKNLFKCPKAVKLDGVVSRHDTVETPPIEVQKQWLKQSFHSVAFEGDSILWIQATFKALIIDSCDLVIDSSDGYKKNYISFRCLIRYDIRTDLQRIIPMTKYKAYEPFDGTSFFNRDTNSLFMSRVAYDFFDDSCYNLSTLRLPPLQQRKKETIPIIGYFTDSGKCVSAVGCIPPQYYGSQLLFNGMFYSKLCKVNNAYFVIYPMIDSIFSSEGKALFGLKDIKRTSCSVYEIAESVHTNKELKDRLNSCNQMYNIVQFCSTRVGNILLVIKETSQTEKNDLWKIQEYNTRGELLYSRVIGSIETKFEIIKGIFYDVNSGKLCCIGIDGEDVGFRMISW
ncbi:MAG: hypothetical protein K1X91_16100 [Bacteriodetes bacterium]|nr:hypothetical protein [Bacteroidota bacterium]